MTTNHSWEEDLGTAEEVLAALKEMKAAAGWEERFDAEFGRAGFRANNVDWKVCAPEIKAFFRAELSRQTRTNNSGRINYQNGYRDALVELREKVEALRCTENNQLDRMQNVTLAAVLSLLTPKP